MNRSLPRVLGCALVAVAFVGTLLTLPASSATGSAADGARQAGPGFHQPAPGSCHEITIEHFYSPVAPSKDVDCDERHTSVTLVSKRLTGKVNWSADGIFSPIWFNCMRKARRVLGGNDKAVAMSSYETSFYIPSKRERARGAKWIRCDLSLLGGRVLQPLPKNVALGSLPLDDDVLRCVRGTGSSLRTTVCSKTHSYRTTGAFRVSGKMYPGPEGFRRMAIRRCPKLTTTRSWLYRTPLSSDYWKAGYRTVVCFSKTKK